LQTTWAEAKESCKTHLGELAYLAAFEDVEEWMEAKALLENSGMRKDINVVYV